MGGTISSIAGGVTDIFGIGDGEENRTTKQTNKTVSSSQNQLADESAASKAAGQFSSQQFGELGPQLDSYFNQAKGDSDQINQLFKQALTKFATGTGSPSPEQLKGATDYIDQTYTNAANTQYSRMLDEAQNKIAARSAALGRNSSDIGYQREFAAQAGQGAEDIANQRGSLIAQRADQVPKDQLQALYTGSSFFNQPLQNAMSNRLSLLNSATSAQQLGLQKQIAGGKTVSTSDQAGSVILPDASMSTKFYNLGSAWNQSDAASASTAGSFMKAMA